MGPKGLVRCEVLHHISVGDLDHVRVIAPLEEEHGGLVGHPGADDDLTVDGLGVAEKPEEVAQDRERHLEADVGREVLAMDVA